MAPGILSETPAVESTREKVELVVVSGKMERKPVTNGEPATNGESHKSEDAQPNGTTPAEPDADAKTDNETKTEEDKKTEPVDQTMKCEIKHLDRRYDNDDEIYYGERKSEVEKTEAKDWWKYSALCVVRNYDSDGDQEGTSLHVHPEPLRQLLADILAKYPGGPVDDVDSVEIEAPYHSLFYYRREIETEGLKRFAEDEEALSYLTLLTNWIKGHFELELAAHDRCISQPQHAIPYDKLWTLFPPGTIVYSKLLGQNRAFRVAGNYYDMSELNPALCIQTDYVDFNGDALGTRRLDLHVAKYPGNRQLNELDLLPIDMLDDAAEVKEELLARGRRFESYFGQHYLRYDGIAIKKTPQGYARFTVAGRVMIDCKTYLRLETPESFTVASIGDSAKLERSRKRAAGNLVFVSADGTPKFPPLSEEDAMLATATVRGYSFAEKKFLEFFIDNLSEIEWNTSCFDELVLDPAVKKTVQALVTTHSQKRETFDDIVKGKGKGLVCVLHGPPGVGKTLTAECVAELVKRPLYMVSSGDLGTCSSELDRSLTRIMDLAATWRTVLLIDEADVFLERRSLHDLHRNAMVSVFLRVLEYYSGILFLTTNRVTTFDDAFKSRIHIPIRYTDLTVESRRKIWRHFCGLVPGGVDIDEKGLTKLAETDLNGRQIKNAIKAAESLAAFDGAKLDLKQLLQITKIQAMFESDLTNLSGIDYTAPGENKKDVESRNMFL
ncbi:ATPase family AAA domain-containing protein 3B [Staphylotrichum tortipilum]|uniref:ATPase family AAA domain-containing protein 3B n=1 Tax=Staphylotrichum tortipilum TaxID=2831512 RepID=A0AAN6MI13_9PEZI|nr:ATPase family AAA domain-containing protein 3B [Staphylotrichum longicolle]